MTEREMVERFHRAMGLPVREWPEMPSDAERVLRCNLLLEETLEVLRACGCVLKILPSGRVVAVSMPEAGTPDLVSIAHEVADVEVIAKGFGVQFGLPSEAVFAEVMRANMSKLGPDGRPVVRADGKVPKGPNYRPPDVVGALERAARCGGCLMCSVNEQQACPRDAGGAP